MSDPMQHRCSRRTGYPASRACRTTRMSRTRTTGRGRDRRAIEEIKQKRQSPPSPSRRRRRASRRSHLPTTSHDTNTATTHTLPHRTRSSLIVRDTSHVRPLRDLITLSCTRRTALFSSSRLSALRPAPCGCRPLLSQLAHTQPPYSVITPVFAHTPLCHCRCLGGVCVCPVPARVRVPRVAPHAPESRLAQHPPSTPQRRTDATGHTNATPTWGRS